MSCTISDLVVKFDQNNVAIPIPRATVLVDPSQNPLFLLSNSVPREIGPIPRRVLSTDVNGIWSIILPWPNEQDPTTNRWLITLPDRSVWMGPIPQDVAGPLTLHDLKTLYGWGLVSATNQEFKPYAIQGVPGPPGGFGSWKGVWNSGFPYQLNDVVSYLDSGNISSYVCVIPSTNNPPSVGGVVNSHWNFVASGAIGPQGPQGQTGNAGPQGNPGPPGLIWRQTWSGMTTYQVDDAVSYNDGGFISSYICISTSTNNPPSTGGVLDSHWNFLAKGSSTASIPDLTGNANKFLQVNVSEAFTQWTQITQDMIAPPFAITSFTPGFSLQQELGTNLVDPSFSAAYNEAIASATLNDGPLALPVNLPATSFAYNNGPSGLPARTYQRTSINGFVDFTLSATAAGGGPTRTSTIQANLGLTRVYYDITLVPGAYDQNFIKGLQSNRLATGFSGTYVFGAGALNKKIYLCWPTGFGTPSSILGPSPFNFPMNLVATGVAFTNQVTTGWIIPGGYDVWESANFITNPFTLVVS